MQHATKRTRKIDFEHLKQTQIAGAFGITPGAINRWECPRNDDGTYSLPEVIEWRESKIRNDADEIDSLKAEKLRKEIEKLEAVNQKIRAETISREEHERILIERGTAWRQLWDQAVLKYANDFVMQPREVVLKMFHRFGKAVSEAFVGGV